MVWDRDLRRAPATPFGVLTSSALSTHTLPAPHAPLHQANLQLLGVKHATLDSHLRSCSVNHPDVLGRVDVPTLYVSARDDPVIPAEQVEEVHHFFGDPEELRYRVDHTMGDAAAVSMGGEHRGVLRRSRSNSDDPGVRPRSPFFVDRQPARMNHAGGPNPNIALATTITGGHHSFVGPALWEPSYLDKAMAEWFLACLRPKE